MCYSSLLLSQDQTDEENIIIPEPLMFDLVRGLGDEKGELEVNTLAEFPLQTHSDVEWAPEIEYVLFKHFAVELEFPFSNEELEAFKVALQWTMGSSKDKKFIHGWQFIAERYLDEDILELNLLYVPAYRFNKIWSAIGLFGVMLEYGDDTPEQDYTILLNASVFADLNERTVVGIEFNNTNPTIQLIDSNEMQLLILPQLHYELNHGFSAQVGMGVRLADDDTFATASLRIIKSF